MSANTKKRRLSRGQKLLGLAALCAVLVGVYVGIGALTDKKGVVETEGTFGIANLSPEEIVSLAWTYEDENITLSRGEAGWQWAEDAAFPLDAAYPERMAQTIAALSATRAIQGAENLADYGLEAPSFTVTVGLQDGSTLQFSQGNQNEINGEYYLKFSKNEAVYTIAQALSPSFAYALYDMMTVETVPVVAQAERLVIDGETNRVDVSRTQDGGAAYYTDAYTWFLTGQPDRPADEPSVTALLDEIAGIAWVNCAQYSADEAALETYGLYNPQRIVRVEGLDADGEAVQATVYLGTMNADGTGYYAKPATSSRVYTIGVEVAEALLAATDDTLRAKEVLIMDYEAVTGITATLDGETYDLRITHGAAATETEAASEDVCTQNGQPVSAAQVRTMFEALTSLSSQGMIPEGDQTGKQILALSILREGHAFPQVEIAFYAYDADCYVVEMFGERRMLTSAADVDRIVRLLNTL